MDYTNEIRDGLEMAFIDKNHNSSLALSPQFLFNNYRKGRKVLASLESELLNCNEFIISAAFITQGGIAPLLQTLKTLEERNIKGKILTTDYLTFSDPKALRKLNSFSNIELRMYMVKGEDKGFHTKGYIFFDEGIVKTIIGSSNLTLSALTQNKEWNTKFVSTTHGKLINDIITEFTEMWDVAETIDDLIDTYENIYQQQKQVAKLSKVSTIQQYQLKPNSMQLVFINNLNRLLIEGADKALLISATGTGKTYASAFALRDFNPRKALFIVHREQIAKQAIRNYMNVFGDTKTMGLLSGNSKEMDAELLFSTMQMMAKPEILDTFKPDEFDVIIIDEVHRAGAGSYQRIMSYFQPKLWLGMTASPDRTDGFDIYSLFDHNIAYEIRLQKALEVDLLCPFHYFGITDLEIDGETFNDMDGIQKFGVLTSEQRVKHIIKQIEYYGFSGTRAKGLIFCNRKEEALLLSEKFNQKGYRTCCLFGEDNQNQREDAMERLVSDTRDDHLDYIFTVDIFNEGVDIPEVNQVIMLRPTQSPIVFIQQLGRGLRKCEGKEYVVILDFIGNYKNNFMIPIALSGDNSYNKDNIRRYLLEGNRIMPGSASIHFDEISKKRIFSSIDNAKLSDLRLIRESYQKLKYKLGRIPYLLDFDQYESLDVCKIFDKFGSYYTFLVKYDSDDFTIRFDKQKEQIIEYISKKLAKGKRVHELIVLKRLLAYNQNFSSVEITDIKEAYLQESIVGNLSNTFCKEQEREKYKYCKFIEKSDGNFHSSGNFQESLKDKEFRKMVNELVEFGIHRYKMKYSEQYKNTNFQLYEKYTYEDVCRLLNWDKNMNALNIGGYFYDQRTKTLPVFINYDKDEKAIAYEDRFKSPNELIALSKHPRKISSSDARHIYNAKEEGNKIYLFVRKNKDDMETKEFYFLGEIYAVGEPNPIILEKSNDDAFEITYELDVPVREDIYDFIIS